MELLSGYNAVNRPKLPMNPPCCPNYLLVKIFKLVLFLVYFCVIFLAFALLSFDELVKSRKTPSPSMGEGWGEGE